MTRHLPARTSLAALFFFATLLPVAAQPLFVSDNAHMFTAQAIRRAEERLGELYRRTGKTVRIITLQTLPAGTTVDSEASRLFRTERLNGLLILIVPSERAVALRVGRYTAQVFDQARRRTLLDILRRRFRTGQYDLGLEEGTAYVAQVLTAALRQSSPASPFSSARNWLVPLLVVLGLALLLAFAVRSLLESRAGTPVPPTAAPPVQPVGSPWGGFFSGMLGGLFGGWLAQQLWPPREPERVAPEPPTWQQDDTLAFGGDVGESATWEDAGILDQADTGEVDSTTQW